MRKVKWGVLGTASIAEACTIPAMLQAKNVEVYAIAGRKPEKVEHFQKKFGIPRAYVGYDELLADPEVEAVYIPLSNDQHCPWTIKALRAGKHVLCEKPIATSVDEVEQMIAAANESGKFLMEAFAYLHSPFHLAIKEEVDSGAIGELIYMESAFLTSDYEAEHICMRRDSFGGCTYDVGCYPTSQILWMFGEEPERVQAVAEFSPEGVDLYTTGILGFSGGRRAVFNCGMTLQRDPERRMDRFQLHGTKGWIKSEEEFNQSGEVKYRIYDVERDVETVKTISTPNNYCLEVEQLTRCILEGEKPHVSHEFTRMNARVMEKILDKIGYK